MFYKGLLKRFVPFLLAFAAGLFVASFFVPIASTGNSWRGRNSYRGHDCRRIKMENAELREDKARLQLELDELRGKSAEFEQLDVPPVPLDLIELRNVEPPPPPKATRAPRHIR